MSLGNFKTNYGLETTSNSVGASATPSLVLDFANRKELDPRITFTRNSPGSIVNEDGYIVSVGNNIPRFDYNPSTMMPQGIRIEPSRTNIVSAREVQDGYVSGGLEDVYGVLSPSGTYTATRMVGLPGTITKYCYKQIATTTSGYHSFSVFVRYIDEPTVFLRLNDETGGNGPFQQFNIQTGVVVGSPQNFGTGTGASSSIVPYKNGWYRLSVSGQINASITQLQGCVFLNAYGGTTVTTSFDVWGPQIERNFSPSSYIFLPNVFTSRASTATYRDNADGILKTASINQARYQYNAVTRRDEELIMEPAATNIVLYSQDYSNAAWLKDRVTVTANSGIAPDGSNTAFRMSDTSDTTSARHMVTQTITVDAGDMNQPLTTSVFAKAANNTFLQIGVKEYVTYGPQSSAWFDLRAGVVVGTPSVGGGATTAVATIEPAVNGWFRCSLSVKLNNSQTLVGVEYNMTNSTSSSSYSATGSGNGSMLLWGAQLEKSNTKTSYIPTTASSVTRSADVYSAQTALREPDALIVSGSNFTSFFNPQEGTFVVCGRGDYMPPAGSIPFASVDDGTTANVMFLGIANAATPILRWNSRTGSTIDVDIYSNSNVLGRYANMIGAYKNNNFVVSASGLAPATDTTSAVPTVSNLRLGWFMFDGAGSLNGTISKLAYYPKRLSDSEIQALSEE